MDYEYDVFLSYPHGYIEEWLKQHFQKHFEWHLTNALGRTPAIFIDREGITSGDSWPERLKKALACSRCLVPIWAIPYFESEWCLYECQMLLERERQLKYRTARNPGGLIHPVNAGDGDNFPDFAKAIQYFDCRDYMLIGDGFTNSPIYTDFQRKIGEWAPQVAKSILQAPPWKKRWLHIPLVELPKLPEPIFSLPTLAR